MQESTEERFIDRKRCKVCKGRGVKRYGIYHMPCKCYSPEYGCYCNPLKLTDVINVPGDAFMAVPCEECNGEGVTFTRDIDEWGLGPVIHDDDPAHFVLET